MITFLNFGHEKKSEEEKKKEERRKKEDEEEKKFTQKEFTRSHFPLVLSLHIFLTFRKENCSNKSITSYA